MRNEPPFRLFAFPFACSLASHLVLEELGVDYELAWVDRRERRLDDGRDYRELNPFGKVPALGVGDEPLLTENLAVLLRLADHARVLGRDLGPGPGQLGRFALYQWLSFVATELHKQVLAAFFDDESPEVTKEDVVRRLLPGVLDHLNGSLGDGSFLLGGSFSVVDAYLFWALLLASKLGVDLGDWPALLRFRERVGERDSALRVIEAERRELLARRKGERS